MEYPYLMMKFLIWTFRRSKILFILISNDLLSYNVFSKIKLNTVENNINRWTKSGHLVLLYLLLLLKHYKKLVL